MSVHLRFRGTARSVVVGCDAPMCGDEYVEWMPDGCKRITTAYDLARLTAVNGGWSHESSPYRTADFCPRCSRPSGRCGVLDVWPFDQQHQAWIAEDAERQARDE